MVAWTLVFHVIGLVFWLGSLIVVTHILAMHTEEPFPEARETLGRLELRLLKRLAHPGAALMVVTGIILVTRNPEYLRERWLQAKLVLVVIMITLDLIVYFRVKAFHAGKVQLRRGECMALHGAIALVFFAILILVLTKPFGLPVHRASAGGPAGGCSAPLVVGARHRNFQVCIVHLLMEG
jgi:protoporphyrinogen IX oxidase